MYGANSGAERTGVLRKFRSGGAERTPEAACGAERRVLQKISELERFSAPLRPERNTPKNIGVGAIFRSAPELFNIK